MIFADNEDDFLRAEDLLADPGVMHDAHGDHEIAVL